MKDPRIREALLYEKLGNKIKCKTCERFCIINWGQVGFCKTRKNIDGKLCTLVYGDASGLSVNPIEKKPFFHFWPGTNTLTMGTWSCNFTCPWCQNFDISKISDNIGKGDYVSPEEFVRSAKDYECQGISISFNEPTLLFEYSLEVFRLAKKSSLYNTYVTNGYMTLEVLKALAEAGLDAMNVDIKGDDEFVKKYCGADNKKVWRNVEEARKLGIWIELTTLVIPGKNDSDASLRSIAEKIVKIDKEMPWHVSRFYPAWKFDNLPATPAETLEKAYKIGKEVGVKFVYVGNILGHKLESTYCPKCNEKLIERCGFEVLEYKITNGKCHKCGEKIPIVGKHP